MHRIIAIVLAPMILTAAAAAQQDEDKGPRINVTETLGWEGCYRPMEWTPVLVEITTKLKESTECDLLLSVAQDELNTLRIQRRLVLMPGQRQQVTLMAKIAYAASDCSLVLDGKDLYWSRKVDLWGSSMGQRLTAVADKELLIGACGKASFGLMRLAERASCRRGGESGKAFVRYRFARTLPPDWTGYGSLDLLVLYDLDWDLLTPHQSRAIAQWVRGGGRLLLLLGAHPLPPEHPVASLLPFRIGQAAEARLPRQTLRNWGCDAKAADKVTCWSLAGAASARGWRTLDETTGTVLFAHGPSAFGTVGVVAFDPSVVGGRQDENLADFWVAHMGPLLGSRQIALGQASSSDSGWSYQLGRSSNASNAVLEHLLGIEELRPLHIGWVVLVLVLLAVLIGPVDYLVLKKLGRLPLTWVTASACILVFSVGAYYGVEYIRGGVLQARMVSVLDGIDSNGPAWQTRYTGVFAPRSDEYNFDGLDSSQWWSGLAPTRNEYLYRHDTSIGSRSIYCLQHENGGNVPVSVPINIWSMQCLLTEAPLARMPLRATVRRDGEALTLTVTNLSPAPIRGGYVLGLSNRRADFGRVEPGKTARFRARWRAGKPWESYVPSSRREYGTQEAAAAVRYTAFLADGCLGRTEAIESYLGRGAVAVCAEYEAAPSPLGIRGRKCDFHHVQLARLVVFPEGDSP